MESALIRAWSAWLSGCGTSRLPREHIITTRKIWPHSSICSSTGIIVSLGYGKTQGTAHRGKIAADISDVTENSPEWYKRGIEAALLAPTAINQQKFRFERNGNLVSAKAGHFGTQLKVDLGIVKCHFELGAGKENFEWEDS